MVRVVRPLLFVLALFAASAAVGQSSRDRQANSQDQAAKQSRDQALPASVRRVERETGGEVISAEPVQHNGREVYHLKVLTPNGRIKVVQDDPNRGRQPRPETRSQQDRETRERDRRRDQADKNDNPEPRSTRADEDDNTILQP